MIATYPAAAISLHWPASSIATALPPGWEVAAVAAAAVVAGVARVHLAEHVRPGQYGADVARHLGTLEWPCLQAVVICKLWRVKKNVYIAGHGERRI